MQGTNGLTDMIAELKDQAASLPEDVSRQMILAAVLASRREVSALRQRLRWVAGLSVTAVAIAVVSFLFDIAAHGGADWAVNILEWLK